MKSILISGVSAIALIAFAQGTAAQDKGPGAAGGSTGAQSPSAQASPPDGGNAAGAGSYLAEKGDAGAGAGGAQAPAGDAAPRGDKSAGNAAGGTAGGDKAGAAAKPEKSAETKGNTEGSNAKRNDDRAGNEKGTDDKDSAATGKSTGESGSGQPDTAAAENKARENAKGAGHVALSGEQRNKVQSAFRSHKGSSVNVHVDVRVGTKLPRNVTLVAVPQDIVIIVPEWRRYRYVVVGDVVCIVDPDTLEIVEVVVLA